MAYKPVGQVKGYVPTSVSNAVKSFGNYTFDNGTVRQGGTGGQNLRSEGYPNQYYYSNGASTATTDRPRTSTGSGSGGSGSGSASAASSSESNAYGALLAAYAQQQRDYEEYLRQQREAAQNAYNRGMSALNSAYDAQIGTLKDNLAETRSQLSNQYNLSRNSINADAENSLKQAYINKMMSQRNLGQQMSAQGLNGGATETTLANMSNNYGNARNNINTTANTNLSNLEGNYSNNVSQALQAYNSAVANANAQKAQQIMQLENALANNEISALGNYQSLLQRDNENYLDLLKAAIANGASFSYDPTSVNNAYSAIALQQAANPDMVNNLTAIQNLMGAENTPGVTMPGVTVANTAVQNNPYLDILRQLAAQRG